ncbi:hypothetical protein QQ045_033698 [Rhodiola kirilowii]
MDMVASMHHKMSTPPSILSKAAGTSSCSIFKVLQSLIEINGTKTYHPQIVSIGPYHHNKPDLQMIQEIKWTYLKSLVTRTQETLNLGLEDYLRAIHPLESKARACYSEQLVRYTVDEFVEMMELDGCFIIELFRKVRYMVVHDEDDPLFNMSWISSLFLRDLLQVENQLPCFINRSLFNLTSDDKQSSDKSLSILALELSSYLSFQRPDQDIDNLEGIKVEDNGGFKVTLGTRVVEESQGLCRGVQLKIHGYKETSREIGGSYAWSFIMRGGRLIKEPRLCTADCSFKAIIHGRKSTTECYLVDLISIRGREGARRAKNPYNAFYAYSGGTKG